MLTRMLLALIGILTIVVGAFQVLRPGLFWRSVEEVVMTSAGEGTPVIYYVSGGLVVLIGLFLLYVGLRRITIWATFIWIIGLLTFAVGLVAVLSPDSFIYMLRNAFFDRSYDFRLVMSYIGGIIRIIIGFVLFVASFQSPQRMTVPGGHAAA